MQTGIDHYEPTLNVCAESWWLWSQRRINLRWNLRAMRTETGSAGLLSLRSRWCAPSGMMIATVELDMLPSTPPLDHGSSSPLLQSTGNKTSIWHTLWFRLYNNVYVRPTAIFTIIPWWSKYQSHSLGVHIKNVDLYFCPSQPGLCLLWVSCWIRPDTEKCTLVDYYSQDHTEIIIAADKMMFEKFRNR
jgi:hypothetical protein